MKIGIIGAGISGLSVGQMFSTDHDVQLFDAQKKGGLIRCARHKGHLYHLVGGHIFNSKNQEVLDWFWSFFNKETEFIKARRNAKIWLKEQLIGYPIENYLYELPPSIAKQIITELLQLYQQGRNYSTFAQLVTNYSNFGDFLQNNFGSTLYNLYFGPYNEKIWQCSPFSISLNWLEGKLPMMNIAEVLTNNIIRSEEQEMVHSTFFYPKEGGSQFIVERLAQSLPILENTPVVSIELRGDKLVLNDTFECDRIVYTGDIRKLPKLLISENLKKAISPFAQPLSELKSTGTTNILCETDDTDISWLYLPNKEIRPHRVIYTGNFSESNQAPGQRRNCTVEFSGYVDEKSAQTELQKLNGELNPLSYHFQESSYVIQKENTRNLILEVKKAVEPFGIHLLGRFAEWEYYNMDKCMEAAMKLKQYIAG